MSGLPADHETCGLCDHPVEVRTGRHGDFVSCSRFPACEWSRSIEPPPAVAPPVRHDFASGEGFPVAPGAWDYLYCITIHGVDGTPAGAKFGRSNNPFRRLLEHRERFPSFYLRLDLVLRGLRADVVKWESLLCQFVIAQGWNLNQSGEWLGPRPELTSLLGVCHGETAHWAPVDQPPKLHVEMESPEWLEARRARKRVQKLAAIKAGDMSTVTIADLKAMIAVTEQPRQAS
jgi:hypothetical protein